MLDLQNWSTIRVLWIQNSRFVCFVPFGCFRNSFNFFSTFLKVKRNKGIQKVAVCVSCLSWLSCGCFEDFLFSFVTDAPVGDAL